MSSRLRRHLPPGVGVGSGAEMQDLHLGVEDLTVDHNDLERSNRNEDYSIMWVSDLG